MFNKYDIAALNRRCQAIEYALQWTDERLVNKVRELERDIALLTGHFGLKFENVNERRVVAIKTSEKFKQ